MLQKEIIDMKFEDWRNISLMVILGCGIIIVMDYTSLIASLGALIIFTSTHALVLVSQEQKELVK